MCLLKAKTESGKNNHEIKDKVVIDVMKNFVRKMVTLREKYYRRSSGLVD